MKILEQFIKGKNPDTSLCEDMLFVSENFIAVIDGATAKTAKLFNGKSGGKAAAEAVCQVLQTLNPRTTVYEATKTITEKISALYEPCEEKGAAAASAIIYSCYRKEIWCIGDCQCIINGEKHLHEKEIDRILSEQRAQIIEEAIKNGISIEELSKNDVGRQAILPHLKEIHKLANKECELGYDVFNGTSVPEDLIKIYTIKENDVVVLASDGYPYLQETLEESEALLAKEILGNPLCYLGYKSTKGISKGNLSFDDRSYVKFII